MSTESEALAEIRAAADAIFTRDSVSAFFERITIFEECDSLQVPTLALTVASAHIRGASWREDSIDGIESALARSNAVDANIMAARLKWAVSALVLRPDVL